jgi:hypothetical protein
MQQPARPAPQGFWGKLGHGLEKAADIGLTTFAPGVAAMQPWTRLGKELQEQQRERFQAQQARTGLEQAQTEASRLENRPVTWTTPSGENVTVPTREWAPLEQARETQQAEAERAQDKVQKGDWVTGLHDGTPEYYDRQENKWTGVQAYEKPEKETPPPKITKMVNGKPHIMEWDPATQDYTTDRGIAPPNYAEVAPNLKTTIVLDANGIPIVKTLAGQTVGASGTGAYAHEEAQAGAIERAGDNLITAINQNKGKFGNMQAIFNNAFLGTPLDDPVAHGLAVQIASFAALQPALHGSKGLKAMQEFERLIGGLPTNPDALIAGIQSIQGTAGAIRNQPTAGGAPAGGGGTPDIDADFKKFQEEQKRKRGQ